MTETLLQAGLQSVVGGIRNACDQTGGGINATAGRIGQRASGMDPPLVRVARSGDRVAVGSMPGM